MQSPPTPAILAQPDAMLAVIQLILIVAPHPPQLQLPHAQQGTSMFLVLEVQLTHVLPALLDAQHAAALLPQHAQLALLDIILIQVPELAQDAK